MDETRVARYHRFGNPDVLEVSQVVGREPGPHEVAVRMVCSGINPLDVKLRSGAQGALVPDGGIIPHSDGAGVIDSVGADVRDLEPGQRVWIWGVGDDIGTASTRAVVPAERVSILPADASFELGASLGIPAVTAALCLSRYEDRLIDPAARPLTGRAVLVRGAGAVAHFTIQLARGMGAEVAVSASPEKLDGAARAGAQCVVDRTSPNAHDTLRARYPHGFDLIVDVSPAVNIESDIELCAPRATIALYGREGGDSANIHFRTLQAKNITIRSIRTVDLPTEELGLGAAAVDGAVRAGALGVGDDVGFPLAIFSLADIGEAHRLIESGSFHGKVLVALQ